MPISPISVTGSSAHASLTRPPVTPGLTAPMSLICNGLSEYWRNEFDWRAEEAALNAFPQFRVALHDIDLHYLHVPGLAPTRCRCSCCMAGPVRYLNLSTSFRA